jgi:hypothetical protein
MLTILVQTILVGGTIYLLSGASVLFYEAFLEIKNTIKGK